MEKEYNIFARVKICFLIKDIQYVKQFQNFEIDIEQR